MVEISTHNTKIPPHSMAYMLSHQRKLLIVPIYFNLCKAFRKTSPLTTEWASGKKRAVGNDRIEGELNFIVIFKFQGQEQDAHTRQ